MTRKDCLNTLARDSTEVVQVMHGAVQMTSFSTLDSVTCGMYHGYSTTTVDYSTGSWCSRSRWEAFESCHEWLAYVLLTSFSSWDLARESGLPGTGTVRVLPFLLGFWGCLDAGKSTHKNRRV